jgi:cell division protein FtsB
MKAIQEQRDRPFTALILGALSVVVILLWIGRNTYASAEQMGVQAAQMSAQTATLDARINRLDVSLQKVALQNRLNQIDDVLFTLNQEAKKLIEARRPVNDDLARRIYDLSKERERIDYDLKQLK